MNEFLERVKSLSPKQLLLLTVQQQKQLNALADKQREPIAIVGAGCRMPGGANDLDAYWELLSQGREGVREIGQDRWDMTRFYDADPARPGKMYAKRIGLLDQIDIFDAEFFGISPREADRMDPQQRLLLETCWQALEHAGHAPKDLVGSKTGVFIGICNADYANLRTALANTEGFETVTAYDGTGTTFSVAAGRISYMLGLKGPCFAVDTACSSSLVAMHVAAQSLHNRESNLALVGGVNLILDPVTSIIFSKANMLAPDGRCKTFDAKANGYVRGEGCGVVVLKRLSDALADGDRILALLRGSALNQDGHSQGLTAPNEKSQVQVIQDALKAAELEPDDIDYIEAHGTGTSLGDPIEMSAIATVFGKSARSRPLFVGSVKTNIGHTEAAAGLAGVLKVVAAMQHDAIPPHLNFSEPSPMINWDAVDVQIPRQSVPWLSDGKRRFAGVSAFGFGGSNAHVILEEAPEQPSPSVSSEPAAPCLLTVSAKSDKALQAQLGQFARHVMSRPELELQAFCHSANIGRNHFACRRAFVAASRAELLTQLEQAGQEFVAGSGSGRSRPLAFLFSGQGAQYVGMGRDLYESQPVFRAVIDECESALRELMPMALREVLWGQHEAELNQTRYTQPALFALELALVKQWESYGIVPELLLGHSVGEYAAACHAGVFSIADGLRLIAARGRLMVELCEAGTMCAVFAPATQLRHLIGDELSIAAYNGNQNTVLSGTFGAMTKLLPQLDAMQIRYQQLSVSHAFHSSMMAPMLEQFGQIARAIDYQPPRFTMISTLTGRVGGAALATAQYWIDHVSAPVRFTEAFEQLMQQGEPDLLEIGPGNTLLGMGRRILDETGLPAPQALPSLRRGQNDNATFLKSLGQLWESGTLVEWKNSFGNGKPPRRVSVPTYPFQGERYWLPEVQLGGIDMSAAKASQPQGHVLLGERLSTAFSQEVYFQNELSVERPDYMQQHRLFGLPVVAGASHLAMFLEAARRHFNTHALQLSDIVFMQPLVLPEQGSVSVQVMLTPAGPSGLVNAQLMSLNAGANPADQSAWRVHVLARISPAQNNKQAAWPEDPHLVKVMWSSDEAAKDFYQRFWDKGYTVGEKFHWLGDGWKTERKAMRQMNSIGRSELSEDYLFYPGLLDACFQVIDCSRNASDPLQDQDTIFIPALIGGLEMIRPPKIDEALYCFAQLTTDSHEGDGNKIVGDLWLVNESNELLARISGFEGRISSRKALKLALTTLNPGKTPQVVEPELLYQLDWESLGLPAWAADAVPQLQAAGPMAMVATERSAAVLAALRGTGLQVYLIEQSPAFAAGEGQWQCNLEDAAQLAQLLAAMQTRHPGAWQWLWIADEFANEQTGAARHCLPLLNLVRQLRPHANAVHALHVLTRAAKGLDRHLPVQPWHTMLWGMIRSAQLECPELRLNLIDVTRSRVARPDVIQPDLVKLEANLPALLAALAGASSQAHEGQWLVRRGALWVPRLHPALVGTLPTRTVTFSPDKTCLISGGMKGLGLVLLRWLVEQGARQLVLLGRSGPTPEAHALIAELTAQLQQEATIAPLQVHCLAVDVSQAAALQTAWQQVAAHCAPLGSIFHVAGTLDDGFIDSMDQARFESVCAPKVDGAWNLHQLSQDMALDHFVAFSSITAILGSRGQTNYAAANAFLDGLMALRRAQGLPGLAINWGLWADGGMSQQMDARHQRRLAESGLKPLSREQGMAALGQLLHSDAPARAMVANIDWSAFLTQYGAQVPGLFRALDKRVQSAPVAAQNIGGLRHKLQLLPADERGRALDDHIRQVLASVLGFSSPKKIKDRDKFFDLGLDSLLAVEIKSRLEKDLETRLATTLIFDYPTFETLSAFLRSELTDPALSDADTAATAADTGTAELSDGSTSAEVLDAMSAEELDSLLGDRLDRLGSFLDEA